MKHKYGKRGQQISQTIVLLYCLVTITCDDHIHKTSVQPCIKFFFFDKLRFFATDKRSPPTP